MAVPITFLLQASCAARVSFADTLQNQLHTEDACNIYRQAIALYRRMLRPDHCETEAVMLKLERCCSAAGRLEEALGVREDLLAFKRHASHDHDFARALAGLASSYSAIGCEQRALNLHNQVFQLLCSVLPHEHPDIATSLMNQAGSLSSLGRLAEALEANRQALLVFTRAFPHDHPNTATALLNIASCLCSLGRMEEALDENRQATDMLRRVFPSDHPETYRGVLNEARIRSAMGMHADALFLYDETLSYYRKVLSPEYSLTVPVLKEAAECCFQMGRYSSALEYFESVLEKSCYCLPLDHPHLLSAISNVEKCRSALGQQPQSSSDDTSNEFALRSGVCADSPSGGECGRSAWCTHALHMHTLAGVIMSFD